MVDTLGDFEVALNLMLAELALPPVNRAQVETRVGKGSENLIQSVLVLAGSAKSAIEKEAIAALFPTALDSYQRHYLTVNGQHSQVYPGVLVGLKGLQAQGLKMACLTNKPTAFARPLLKAKGLDGFFEVVFGGDAFERKKPDPLPLLKTCEALGVAPGRTLMLGDSSNDAKAARSAGCPVVLVSYGYNHGEPVQAVDCDAVVDTMEDLASVLVRWPV